MADKIHNLQLDIETHMKKCIYNFKINLNKIHVGRISSDILRPIMIKYHESYISLTELTHSVVEDYRTLTITVFDVSIIKMVEKAILESNLGFVPIIHGNVIRIKLPLLTEDRRRTLTKMVRTEAEKSKISIRNIRRTANDTVKTLLKCKEINEDIDRIFQNKVQKLTNFWIKEVDLILKEKELELMKF